MKRLKTIICGVRFGQFYIEALKKYSDEFEIVGIMSTGSSKSVKYAEKHGIKVFTSYEEIPEDIDLACVIIRSGVLGGDGTEITCNLLKKGINVIQEQPIHTKDLLACLKIAKQHNAFYKIADFYLDLPFIKNFISCVSEVLQKKDCTYIEMTCANQVSYTMIDILIEIFGNSKKLSIYQSETKCGPYGLVMGTVGEIPILFKVYNMIEANDPDGGIYELHKIKMEFNDGTISLEDTHGPIIWKPKFCVIHDYFIEKKNKIEKQTLLRESSLTLFQSDKLSDFESILSCEWPKAIGKMLCKFKKDIINKNNLMSAQKQILGVSCWNSITDVLGHPNFLDIKDNNEFTGEIIKKVLLNINKEKVINAISENNVYVGNAENLISIDIDASYIERCIKAINYASLMAMITGLYSAGNFQTEIPYTIDEIIENVKCKPKFIRIIKRWIFELVKERFIKEENNKFIFVERFSMEDVLMKWENVKKLWGRGLASENVIEYYINHVKELPALLQGEKDAMFLLFPNGDIDIANLFYRGTIMEEYLAEVIGETVEKIAFSTQKKKIRILELGAGTGATTDIVLRNLKEKSIDVKIEYIFSDISRYFLSFAKEKYSDLNSIEYKILDIDNDFQVQGIEAESIDIIIAAGMLNNAENTECVIESMVKILVRGGTLLISEPVGESLELLISQAFMMTEPKDKRSRDNSTFYSLNQWLETLKKYGVDLVTYIPEDSHILSPLNQKLFIGRKKD